MVVGKGMAWHADGGWKRAAAAAAAACWPGNRRGDHVCDGAAGQRPIHGCSGSGELASRPARSGRLQHLLLPLVYRLQVPRLLCTQACSCIASGFVTARCTFKMMMLEVLVMRLNLLQTNCQLNTDLLQVHCIENMPIDAELYMPDEANSSAR